MFAKVLVDIQHIQVNRFFDYKIPNHLLGVLERGMRVIVPFNEQKRLGYILEITETSTAATKDIIESLDIMPTINEELFLLIDELMQNNNHLLSQIFSTVVPNELLVGYHKQLRLLDSTQADEAFNMHFNRNGIWKLAEKDIIHHPRIKHYLRKEVVALETVLKEKKTLNQEQVYTFNAHHHYPKAKQYEFLHIFDDQESITKKQLLDQGATSSMLNTLLKHNVLSVQKRDVFREVLPDIESQYHPVTLNSDQQQAAEKIINAFDINQTFLLKGVTGSGKTEVYLHVIEELLKKDGCVLFLVPEIALIMPMAAKLKARFSDVAIYHSGLNKGERYDQYRYIQQGDASIILGTRSSIFLPIENLKLIIIDEEHDNSYQQTEGLYYDTKALAHLRASYHQIPLVFGSATPSIETMYRARQNMIQLLELPNRPFDNPLPSIAFVDMKQELKDKHTSIFSRALLEAMKDRLAKNEQTMLLFNRKGYAPFVLCRRCGDVPSCPSCGIDLTYYKDKQKLTCHYCGHTQNFESLCQACQTPSLKEVGVGIEYVEQVLKKTLPQARILRMDANATKTKGSFETIWKAFNNQEADILLGTQMIAKGLDFPKVTLVGILMADLALSIPSYLAAEQTYNLLSQMTGRSGRLTSGEAIIQGYQLDHYAIQEVNNSYDAFYKEALYQRQLTKYPPFGKIAHLIFEGESYLKTYQRAFQVKKLVSTAEVTALGPSPAMIKKHKNKYRFILTLKYPNQLPPIIFEVLKFNPESQIDIRFTPSLDVM